MNPWIQTASGAAIDLLAPRPEDVTLPDVAHALAFLCRYTGHSAEFYSVAQHSVLVARILHDQGHPEGVIRAGLMHDAHEAYLGDVATPIKRALATAGPAWYDLERRHARAVRLRFGLPIETPEPVRAADRIALLTERRDLLGPETRPWGIPGEAWSIEHGRIYGNPPDSARAVFLEWAARLGVV